MPTVSFYKIGLLLSLVALSSSLAGLGYYYQNRTVGLNNQVASLNTQNDSQHDQIDSLKGQIANLTQQIKNLNSNIDQLQSTNTQLLNQIIQLRNQLGGTGGLCSSGKTLTIGELTDLSDGLSNIGIKVRESSLLAVDDVNSLLSSGGCNLRFSLVVDDYALDNSRALSDLQSFSASGIQIVLGPLNSGAAQFILPFANSNHIVLISPSSSSTALGIPNDYLFRTSPTDAAQSRVAARMMFDLGARAVIIVQRHDGYGISVGDATALRFKALGGEIIDTIQYDVLSTDFTSVLQTLRNDFNQYVVTHDANKIALYFVSYEELGSLVIQASHQSGFPRTQLPWFGADGTTLDPVLTGNATTGPLLVQLRYTSPQFYTVNNTKTLQFYHRFNSLYPGQSCDQYCLGAYDDVWLSALATLQAGSYDGTKIQAIISTVASNYYGLTGWTELDSNGDRVPQSYQIWKIAIVGSPSQPSWILAGTWDALSDSITWLAPP